MSDELERIRAIRKRAAVELRSFPNVSGIGVGYKYVGGQRTDRIVITVYVRKKLPPAELDPGAKIPAEIEGVPTDVIEVGKVSVRPRAASINSPPYEVRVLGSPGPGRFSTLIGGIWIMRHLSIYFGTMGAVFVDRKTRQAVILSNDHVLPGPAGFQVRQPGIEEDHDVIGRIHRLRFDPARGIDAATAILNCPRDYSEGEVRGIGRLRGFAAPRLGTTLTKSGAHSGVTSAEVTAVDVEHEVDYRPERPETVMHDVFVLDGGTGPGDSGSIWIDSDLRAVGLNFAGRDQSWIFPFIHALAIATPMQTVAEAMELELGWDTAATQFMLLL